MRRRDLIGAGAAGVLVSQLARPAWAQKPGRWLRFETPNFVVYAADDEAKARAEVVALERFHALLTRIMPRIERQTMKLTVYLADSRNDFEQAGPQMGRGVGGFYFAGIEHVRAVTSPNTGERQRDMRKGIRALDARAVLFHEYAHHYMRANSRIAYPPWYREGFAEFVSTADFEDDKVHIGKFSNNRAMWLTLGDWLGIDSFLAKDPGTMSMEDRAQFYAQAWLATHFMFQTPDRSKGFDRYAKALQEGGHPLESFQPAFGISRGDFDKELKSYKRKSITYWTSPDPAAQAGEGIVATRLSPAADDC